MRFLKWLRPFSNKRRDEARRVLNVYDRFLPAAFLVGIACFLAYYTTLAAPSNFPSASLVKIKKNTTLQEQAFLLKERHLIRSVRLFEWSAKLFGAEETVVPGEYFFAGPESVVLLARRLAHGDFELTPVRVTIPEGLSSLDMGPLLDRTIPDFDAAGFISEAQNKEGYLFPDTYYFMPGEDPKDVIDAMQANFQKKINDPAVTEVLHAFGKPLTDVVIMASLLEKEAAKTKDRQIIAGILWKRLSINMPLQVDAVFPYIIGKNSFELTRADLKTQSPYNTYANKGLPPGAIDNPSLDSIVAAATPINTPYLYYLSDLHGNFHFCATYTCQLANQRKYLK